MEARRGVALPPPKPGSQEAGESFVLCCRLLFAGSHLFFKLRFRRRAKPQQERSDSDEPPHLLPGDDVSGEMCRRQEESEVASPGLPCTCRDALCAPPALSLLCWHQGLEVTAAISQVGRVLLPAAPLDSGLEDIPLHTTPAAASLRALTAGSSYPGAARGYRSALTWVPGLGRKRSSAWSVLAMMLLCGYAGATAQLGHQRLQSHFPGRESFAQSCGVSFLPFCLCCQAPRLPAQQRQRKPRQTAKVRHDLTAKPF